MFLYPHARVLCWRFSTETCLAVIKCKALASIYPGSASEVIHCLNSKERSQWQRVEEGPVFQSHGYDPQKHREMSKPYLGTDSSGLLVTRHRLLRHTGWLYNTLVGTKTISCIPPACLQKRWKKVIKEATFTPSNPPKNVRSPRGGVSTHNGRPQA